MLEIKFPPVISLYIFDSTASSHNTDECESVFELTLLSCVTLG